MVRYIYCILLGAFLVLGVHYTLPESHQETYAKADATTIKLCYGSDNYEPPTAVESSLTSDRLAGDRSYNCGVSDFIPGNLLIYRNNSPSKILRFSDAAITERSLRTLRSQLSEMRQKGLSFYMNPAKSSYRYYIYTLQCIRI